MDKCLTHIWKYLPALVFLFLITAIPPAGADISKDSGRPGEILILNSYHNGFKWTDDITAGIRTKFLKKNGRYNLSVEYMDTKRFFDEEYLGMLETIYRRKAAKFRYDLIISSDNNAFEFLKRYRDRIFPGIPVVFCGVNYFTDRDLTGFSNVTGVNEAMDMKAGFDLILKLHPDTKEIVFITDTTTTGKRIRSEFAGISEGFGRGIRFTLFDRIAMKDLLSKLRTLSPGTVVYYTIFFKDGNGEFFEYDESASQITENCPVPVYGAWDFSLGSGIVGGMLTSGTAQGEKAAELALTILEGKPASSLPVVKESPNRYMFDAGRLKKFHIDSDSLPEESIIINLPYSFLDKHRKLIAGSLLLFLIMAAVISLLVSNIVLRRLAERSLQETQLQFKALFDSTHQLIGVVGKGGRLVEVNRTALETIETPREELLGMPFWETPWWSGDPESKTRVKEGVEKALLGEFIRKELKFVSTSGSITHVDFTLKPVKDHTGNIKLLIAEGRDITEQKHNEAIILDKKDQIEKIINTVPMMVFAKDINGRYLLANRAVSGIYGLSPDGIIGKHHGDLHKNHSPAEVKKYLNEDREVIEKGVEKLAGHETITLNDGSVRVLQVSKIPFTYDGQKTALGVAADVTELTDAEAELRRLNDELEQRVMERTGELEESLEILRKTQKQLVEAGKMSALGTLVAGVAHEINTPLGICLTEASFIEKKIDSLIHAAETGAMTRDDFHGSSAMVREATKSILGSLEKTADLIQGFKQVAVEETFEEKRPFNVRDYIEDALHSLHNRIDRMGHRVTILCPEDLTINSYADTFSLIITNFLMNSVDHGFEGVEHGEIGLRVVRREVDLLIGYKDNGKGMEKETSERIFEPFFTTRRGRGPGLGMHLVYNLVTQRLGGSIRCKSFVGEGVEFIITLPLSS